MYSTTTIDTLAACSWMSLKTGEIWTPSNAGLLVAIEGKAESLNRQIIAEAMPRFLDSVPSFAGKSWHLNLWKQWEWYPVLCRSHLAFSKPLGCSHFKRKLFIKLTFVPSFGDLLSSLVLPFCCYDKIPQPWQFIEGRVHLGLTAPEGKSPSSSRREAQQTQQA